MPQSPTSSALPQRHAAGLSRQARMSFGLSLLALAGSSGVLGVLRGVFGRPVPQSQFAFPIAFGFSSLLLVLGSVALHRATVMVRRERQAELRGWMLTGLAIGALFVGVQTYGLWALFPGERSAAEASAGVTPFVLALSALHGLHFCVVVLATAFVTARTFAGRYDHEYYWGVVVCGWLWHVLGIVWAAILVVFAIAL
jgi:heme/copper-type cytochrome/quinol oxidase subunit 3